MNTPFAIAIDGPSGAGKSTVAKRVAADLDILYLDTGAMYRAIGVYMLDHSVDPKDEQAVSDKLDSIDMDIQFRDGTQRTLINGEDLTGRLRENRVSMAASDVSRHPAVRRKLWQIQRALAERESFILDGRDIGTVVLPDAPCKIFLTAPAEVRARRRLADLAAAGENVPYEQVLDEMRRRDRQDAERSLAPTKPADDAVVIDSGTMTLEETITAISEVIREKLGDRYDN